MQRLVHGAPLLLRHERHADRVVVRFERPTPLQIGGDAEGWRDELAFGMAANPVEIVDFGPRAAA